MFYHSVMINLAQPAPAGQPASPPAARLLNKQAMSFLKKIKTTSTLSKYSKGL
jgi:hypothetical protein